jgi:glycosyltransferase involved in cell wall biosynthesis
VERGDIGGSQVKIAAMTRWNALCGVSAHAELVGRAWVDMGHTLKVLAPLEADASLTGEDEPYVRRCFELKGNRELLFDQVPFSEEPYDIFVVEHFWGLPMADLLEVYPRIKQTAKTVLVFHEGGPVKDPSFYRFTWDAVVCFDERYKRFLATTYPEETIRIIPYPCHPAVHGDKRTTRLRLGLPLDRKIVFNYGLNVFKHLHLLPTMERLSDQYPLVFLTVTDIPDWYDLFEAVSGRYKFVELRREAVPYDLLYSYLHASDALIYHKDSTEAVVVPSTCYVCFGSGCPILAYDTNFVEALGQEVIRYRDLGELAERLSDVFEERENVKLSLRAAAEHARENSNLRIARRFAELFESLTTGAGQRRRRGGRAAA